MNERILIVEDEEKLARFVEMELAYEGYQIEKALDGRKGLELAQTGGFDLMVLDIMLPGLNGMEVLRRVRKESEMPVIMLTARDNVMDKVSGLDGGADDYVTKPFAIEELLARIRSCLRKKGGVKQEEKELTVGGLLLDEQKRMATLNGEPLELTKKEFDLLKVLMENKGIVLTRDILLERVWGYDFMGETNAVDVYIRYLRAKIDEAYGTKLIHTIRGVGYVIKEE